MWTSRGELASGDRHVWGRQMLHLSGLEVVEVVMSGEQALEVEKESVVAGD